MKQLYKMTRGVYDAHKQTYNVYYKNWFKWKFDRAYVVDHYSTEARAKELAIERAQAMLNTVEVFRATSFDPFY